MERRTNDLVRLALFSEQRRIPIRREEISKKGKLDDLRTRLLHLHLLTLCHP